MTEHLAYLYIIAFKGFGCSALQLYFLIGVTFDMQYVIITVGKYVQHTINFLVKTLMMMVWYS